MSLPLQNNYADRLAEKLQRHADKRGQDSNSFEELYRLKSAAGAPAETPKGGKGKLKNEAVNEE